MGQKQSVPAADASGTGNAPSATIAGAASSTQQRNESRDIAAAIERRSNPPEADATSHNFGQPLRPPHSSSPSSPLSSSTSSSANQKDGAASKLVTDCRAQQRASLACIEENYQNKNQACAGYFEAYKKCRKEEHQKKLEANAAAWN